MTSRFHDHDTEREVCINCMRDIEPDGDGWGHVAAALPADHPAAVEFWSNPCPMPDVAHAKPPESGP